MEEKMLNCTRKRQVVQIMLVNVVVDVYCKAIQLALDYGLSTPAQSCKGWKKSCNRRLRLRLRLRLQLGLRYPLQLTAAWTDVM